MKFLWEIEWTCIMVRNLWFTKKHEKIKRKKSCENCYSKTYFEFQASKDIPKSFKLKLLSNIIEF